MDIIISAFTNVLAQNGDFHMPYFDIITDSTANLTEKLIKDNGITEIPFPYFSDGQERAHCTLEAFDDVTYYTEIKNGVRVTTSQINPQKYIDLFRTSLEAGRDILFIGISSGISGSFASATIAKEQLTEEFPERKIELIDSLGASLGEGLLVLNAAKFRADGMPLKETAERIISHRDRMYQVFTVDDLIHLKRTGRLSNAGAIIGTVLGIKPLLKGDQEGKIVSFDKVRGRARTINAMAEKYFSLVKNAETQTVGIAHANCGEDAEQLAKLIRKQLPPKEILIVKYEPVTGSHVGPGALALFFEGDSGVRLK
ncbi:MAG: DegV family protein [Acutalibacteraceae bacterium]